MQKNHSIESLRAQVNKILPANYTPGENKAAIHLFDLIDANKNGYVSLAEVDNGLKSICNIPKIPGLHSIIVKAYDKARIVKKSTSISENNYVSRDEFIYLLIYLRIYYEFYMEFTLLDENEDQQITIQEMEKGKSLLQKWKIDTSKLLEIFKQMDRDGRGTVSFREFCNWGINKYFSLQFGTKQ